MLDMATPWGCLLLNEHPRFGVDMDDDGHTDPGREGGS